MKMIEYTSACVREIKKKSNRGDLVRRNGHSSQPAHHPIKNLHGSISKGIICNFS